MKSAEHIIDKPEKSGEPPRQGEIPALAENHGKYGECEELHPAAVPLSAAAGCLPKYSSGSNPVFGIFFEGKDKKSQKRFFIKTGNMPEAHSVPESFPHPYPVKFAREKSNISFKS